jgi:hypothetical protein
LLLTVVSAVILESEYLGTHDHILLSQIRDFLNLEAQDHIAISPKTKESPFIPPGIGSPLVPSYDSQGYNGSLRTSLHAETV